MKVYIPLTCLLLILLLSSACTEKKPVETCDKSEPGTLEHVFAITEDHNGNIWFGDRDTGIWRYDGQGMTNYTVDPSLSSQMPWSIYEDRDKSLLIAMAFGGVYQFNGTSFERRF